MQKYKSLKQNHEHTVLFELAEHLVNVEDNERGKLANLDHVVHIFEVIKTLSFELDHLKHDEEDLGEETHRVENVQKC